MHTEGTQNKGWVYNSDADTWSEVNVNGAPSARLNHSAVCINQKVILWGGMTKDKSTDANPADLIDDGAVYDPALDSWELLQAATDVPAQAHQFALESNGKMILAKGHCELGGFPTKYCDTFNIFDLATKSWQVVKPKDESLLESLQFNQQSIAEVGGSLFIFGGFKAGDLYGEKAFLIPLTK